MLKLWSRAQLRVEAAWYGLTNPVLALSLAWYFASVRIILKMPAGKEKAQAEMTVTGRALAVCQHFKISNFKFGRIMRRWLNLGIYAGYIR